jgi:aminomethyltransferase
VSLVANLLSAPIAAEVAPFHSKTYPLEVSNTKTELRVARTGYTGEDGVELFCDSGVASALFQKLIDLGAKPCGLAARDTLRLEACLRLYGHELDESTDPLEAGLGWTVKLDKQDFIGKGALQEVARRGPTRKLVGFEMKGRGIARAGYPLLSLDGSPVGVCTSGAPSPTTGLNIGLGYLPVDAAEVGTEFLVDCRGKSIPAQVVKTPFYRRPKVA